MLCDPERSALSLFNSVCNVLQHLSNSSTGTGEESKQNAHASVTHMC